MQIRFGAQVTVNQDSVRAYETLTDENYRTLKAGREPNRHNLAFQIARERRFDGDTFNGYVGKFKDAVDVVFPGNEFQLDFGIKRARHHKFRKSVPTDASAVCTITHKPSGKKAQVSLIHTDVIYDINNPVIPGNRTYQGLNKASRRDIDQNVLGQVVMTMLGMKRDKLGIS